MKTFKTKSLITFILAAVMLFALAACGNNDNDNNTTPATTPAETTVAAPDVPEETTVATTNADASAYLAAMDEFVVAFEDLMDILADMIEELEYLVTDEEVMDWIYDFELMHNEIGAVADILASITEFVPDEYFDSHVLVTLAVAAVYEAMWALDASLAAGILGDEEAMWAGIEAFIFNLLAADELWMEAVY